MENPFANPYAGLLAQLGADEEKVNQNANMRGLLGLAGALAEAGGRSRQPTSIGQALGRGAQMYQSAYDSTIDSALKSMMMRQKMTDQANLKKAIQGSMTPVYTQGQYDTAQASGELDRTRSNIDPMALESLSNVDILSKSGIQPQGMKMDREKALAALAQFGGIEGLGAYITATKPEKADLPSSYREYMLAVNDPVKPFTGSYQDWVKANPKGNVVYNYPPGALPLGKEGQKDIDEALMGSGSRMQMYNQIQSGFDPAYLSLPFRGQQAWATLKDKFGQLADTEKATLGNYTQFRQNTVENMNKVIKEFAGAAVTPSEATRVLGMLPNAGTGIFDGDSPTEFKAKLDNSMKQIRMIEARLVYMKKNGLSLKDIPLSNMPQIMNDRANQIAKENNLNLDDPKDRQTVKNRLSIEFGITTQ